MRTFYLLSAAARSFDVTLVTPATTSVPHSVFETAGIRLRVAPAGPRKAVNEAAKALSAGVRGEPYVMYRRHERAAIHQLFRGEAHQNRPDILYFDHLDSFAYSGIAASGITVCDLHNVYSLLAQRAANEQTNVIRRAYLLREARLLAKVESRVASQVDLLFSVSREEAEYFKGIGGQHVCVVPNGVDCDRYADLPTGRESASPLVMYVGAMSWQPNAAAARFLALEVLPALRRRVPTVRVRIVGRDPLPDVVDLARQPGVEVTGRVDNIVPHLKEAHVLAVPLESGGGTRLKILEAFAAGLPVVSTPVGSEGIEAEPDRHLCVVPRERFADTLLAVLASPARGREMAAAARALAREVYDWRVVGRTAVSAITSALTSRVHTETPLREHPL